MDQEAVRRVFRFVTGFLNGVYQQDRLADVDAEIQKLLGIESSATLQQAFEALAVGIESACVPVEALGITKELIVHSGRTVCDCSRLRSALGLEVSTSEENESLPFVQDESICQPVVDGEAQLQSPQKHQPSHANQMFKRVLQCLLDSVADNSDFQRDCDALAKCILNHEVPQKGREVLRHELHKATPTAPRLDEALRSFLCGKCGITEPPTQKCAGCGGAGKSPCLDCKGSGRFKPTCRSCDGTGRGRTKRDCPTCQGCGVKDCGQCRACQGGGNIRCDDCLGDGKAFCAECTALMRFETRSLRLARRNENKPAFKKESGPPPAGVSIQRCNRAELTRMQNLWLERQGADSAVVGRDCSGEVLEAWRVDNPLLSFQYAQRRKDLRESLRREPSKLEGYHGTMPENILSICSNGFDASRRAGQVYGAGEYFAKNPHVSVGYCRGGEYMLVCGLSLGHESSTPDNLDGDHIWVSENGYYVIKQPNQVLIQFIVKFTSSRNHYGAPRISETLERLLSTPYSTKPPEERKPLPRPRPCQMSLPEATALWIGLMPKHVPEETLKRAVSSLLKTHAPTYPFEKIQIVSTHFSKAHVHLQRPMPKSVVLSLNTKDMHIGDEIIRVCVDNYHGGPAQQCPKTIAGFCRGRNLRFTCPCWCQHNQPSTAHARFSLQQIDLDGAKGDEIVSRFMASSPFHNGYPRVVGIKQIKNDILSKRHQEYRDYLANKHGEEPTTQELYHGTNCNILDIIYKDGIKPPSDMKADERCPISGGKGLCTSLCNNDCEFCTEQHGWDRCHMYGLGIYLADMAQKSHRYVSQPKSVGCASRYRMIVCSVIGKSYELEGYLKDGDGFHNVTDVRSLTQDDVDAMITPCGRCKRPSYGVGASIASVGGERWGRVVAEEDNCWRLHTGRIAKKASEDVKWIWTQDAELSAEAIETAPDKSDLLYVKGLGPRCKHGLSVVHSEYIAFHPYQCLPLYEIEYEM